MALAFACSQPARQQRESDRQFKTRLQMRVSLLQSTSVRRGHRHLCNHVVTVDILAGKIDSRILIYFILFFITLYSEVSFPLILLILV